MKFLADMGISQSTVAWLGQNGHHAIHLHEEGLQTMPDKDIVAKALAEGEIILTFDLDFGALLAAAGTKLPSVIIFRLQDARPESVNSVLQKILSESTAELEKGAIISANERGYRVRHLPIQIE